jgi:hypothetical protein
MLSRISVAALAAALVCAPRASGQTKVTSTHQSSLKIKTAGAAASITEEQ